ncbi:MAG TPA: phosphate/phosphite/phosphonate ABC transporter substrate-binding protein [Desulfuromonadaceae bacterium]|jgi:phosphonate transport system substrate-binding protein
MRPTFLLLLLIFLFGSMAACNSSDPIPISLKNKETVAGKLPVQPMPLRIGLGAMITPRAGYVYYQRLGEYIGQRLGRPVQLVDREDYQQMNQLLEKNGVDMAFVCAGPYVEGKKKFGMELLVMPIVKGQPIYYSYIIVPKDSPAKRLQDLQGKTFAFTDPKSNSGKLVPTYMLAKMNKTPGGFFSSHRFTHGHDISIRAVAENLVDGAAVDSLIWDYVNRTTPEITAKIRIIEKSEPYGIPPVVVRPGLDPKLKKQISEIMINIASDRVGKEILQGMMIDGFVSADDSRYDTIRQLNDWLARRKQ